MKKSLPVTETQPASPAPVRPARLAPPGRISRKFLRALPAAASVLIISTLILQINLNDAYVAPSKVGQPTASAESPAVSDAAPAASVPFANAEIDPSAPLSRDGDVLTAQTTTTTTTATPEPTATPAPTPYPLVFDAAGVPQEGMPVEDFTADNTTCYVQVNKANVRALPSTSADIVTAVRMGDQLTRTGYGINWSAVQTADGQTGYVLTELISTEFVAKPTPTPIPTPSPTPAPTEPASAPDPTAAPVSTGSPLTEEQKTAIIDLAKSCLGIRYVYGSEDRSGFDCSGFTTYIYKELFGITLSRSAKAQSHDGQAVALADIEVGDIICFDWDNHDGVCDHVGLYIGGGQYIHAAHSRGKVVESTLKSTNPIVSIRRIIN